MSGGRVSGFNNQMVVEGSRARHHVHRIEMDARGVNVTKDEIVETFYRAEHAERFALQRNIVERTDAIYIVMKEGDEW